MPTRPDFVAHWSELEAAEPHRYADDAEPMGHDASLGRRLGLLRIGIHHVRLPPGRRTSFPHAESAEEEFVHVIEGRPDAWIDGELHALSPGDSVAFPSGTGIAHSFLNNTDEDVRLLVVGEKRKSENRGYYPLNPGVAGEFEWIDAPRRQLGPHDGRPIKGRGGRS